MLISLHKINGIIINDNISYFGVVVLSIPASY